MTEHYTPQIGSDLQWYAAGPGNGNGYYSGTLWPESRFETEEETIKACRMMNIAFREGVYHQRTVVKTALGL